MITFPFSFLKTVSGGGGGDVDATAYINAVLAAGGSLSSPEQTAINTLFVDLKSAGLWNDLLAFYPMMGGVQASCALNGIRTNSAYDATFNGGWTFSSQGALGNGSNTYATFNIYGDTLPSTDSHLAVYGTVANANSSGYDLSINYNNNNGKVQQIILAFQNGTNGYYEYNGYSGVSGARTNDFAIMTRNTSNTYTIRARNGVALADKFENCYDIDNTRQWMLGCEQSSNGNRGLSTNNRYIWAGFGSRISAPDLLVYQNVVNTFQTTLGRNTY
jgi:hypothetical protein